MSYQGSKPFGRRKTDKPLSEQERRQFQTIRRDVEEDSTGQIRRYLRLASKALEGEDNEDLADNPVTEQKHFRTDNPKKHAA
jgi:hypothetical protein